MIKNRNRFSEGDRTSVGTWTSQCSISSTGVITTNGSISATGSIEGGSITTSSGNISSTSCNIQTRDGTVGSKNGSFQNLSCTGLQTLTVTESKGIYMGLDSDAAGGTDVCADTNQYIHFTTLLKKYNWRPIYHVTNNDFKMQANWNASASLALKNSTLTTNSITCRAISCSGTTTKPTVQSVAGVYIGLHNVLAGAMDICCSSSPYIHFTIITNDFRERLIYAHTDNSFIWQVCGSETLTMKLISSGLTVNVTSVSSGKRLKFNDKTLTNALKVIRRLEPVEYEQTYVLVDQ